MSNSVTGFSNTTVVSSGRIATMSKQAGTTPVTSMGLPGLTGARNGSVTALATLMPASSTESVAITTSVQDLAINSEAKEKNEPEEPKLPWYASFAKEGLKIGVVIGASLIGGVLGGPPGSLIVGALASGLMSAVDQALTKGKVDVGTVLIETTLGLIPGGIGKALGGRLLSVVSKESGKEAISWLAKKKALSSALSGGFNGGLMGYLGGVANIGYKDYKKTGKFDWHKANQAGQAAIISGIVGGVFAGMLGRVFSQRVVRNKNPEKRISCFPSGLKHGSKFCFFDRKTGKKITAKIQLERKNNPENEISIRVCKGKTEICYFRFKDLIVAERELRRGYLYNGEKLDCLWLDMLKINPMFSGGDIRKAIYYELIKISEERGFGGRIKSQVVHDYGSIPAIGSYKAGFRVQLGGSCLTEERLSAVNALLVRASNGERISSEEASILNNIIMFLPRP